MFRNAMFLSGQAKEIFGRLKAEDYLYGLEEDGFAARLAYYFSEINALHPFRDAHVIIGIRLEKPSKINGFALLSPNFFMPERGERNHRTSTYIAGQQYESLIAIKATILSADGGFELCFCTMGINEI